MAFGGHAAARPAPPLLRRLFSSRFLLCCLLTDFPNPIYSPARMKLMDYVPKDVGECSGGAECSMGGAGGRGVGGGLGGSQGRVLSRLCIWSWPVAGGATSLSCPALMQQHTPADCSPGHDHGAAGEHHHWQHYDG